ncbi:MAG: hypothetical protein QM564_03120 [Bergeyella sp.]
MQLDNPLHFNSNRERKKAIQALTEAKKVAKKPVFLKKGYSKDFEKFKTLIQKNPLK